MAPTSSGRQSKPYRVQKNSKSYGRKRTRTTTSTNKHRFEPFSERIAKLKVDPVRRGDAQRQRDDNDDESCFIAAHERWRDINLSEDFSNFSREVGPLCQSLPQVLLYEKDIVDILFKYLELGNALSLEPILDLITQLARDMGWKYEIHFAKTVQKVSHLAATHESVEVIEWAFTCLAWLFKYLSRLLVPDLRQLYDLMAPYLGKERHKFFVSRFSAESMSFLVRKAAAQYHKDKQPLTTIVKHSFRDLSNGQFAADRKEYQEGIVILFSTAIKGIQNGTHSSAKNLMRVLLFQLNEHPPSTTQEDTDTISVVEGIVIDLLNHTDAAGFSPILHEFFDSLSRMNTTNLAVFTRLFLVILTTHKGEKIEDWTAASRHLGALIDSVDHIDKADASVEKYVLLQVCSVLLKYSPDDVAASFSKELFQKLNNPKWNNSFLPFAFLVADRAENRFVRLVLPELEKFIVARWGSFELPICNVLPEMIVAAPGTRLTLPQKFNDRIINQFKLFSKSSFSDRIPEHLTLCQGYLNLLESVNDIDETRTQVADVIFEQLDHILCGESSYHEAVTHFIVSAAFKFATDHTKPNHPTRPQILRILSALHKYGRMKGFVSAVTRLLQETPNQINLSSTECLAAANSLIWNLGYPPLDLRQISLDAILSLYRAAHIPEPAVLRLLQNIENTPVSVQSLRQMSLSISKIPGLYKESVGDKLMWKAVPYYCFGLLHVQLTPLWKDACQALQQISSIANAESLIIEKALALLQQDMNSPSPQQEYRTYSSVAPEAMNVFPGLEHFRSVDLDVLDNRAATGFDKFKNAYEHIDLERLEKSKSDSFINPYNRGQGLRVLQAVPHIAEKSSRLLVPLLLNWVHDSESKDFHEIDVDGSEESDLEINSGVVAHGWTRADQKALLAVFDQFTNPTVLYRSKEVYNCLKELLGNGDSEIQKSAMKALLAWKEPSILPYKENLLNLLDDARFREELTVFLDPDDPDKISPEHKPYLLPILLRLLYGRVVTRTGLGGARGTQEARRKAVLTGVARFGPEAKNEFTRIALGHFSDLKDEDVFEHDLENFVHNEPSISVRRAAGMLRMLNDIIGTFSDVTAPYVYRIARATIYCLIRYRRGRETWDKDDESKERHDSLFKTIRQEGLKCLSRLYAKFSAPEWTQWLEPFLFEHVIDPRVESLPNESAQSVSYLFRLFATWASLTDKAKLFHRNSLLLSKIAECLTTSAVKIEVKRFVLKDILGAFIETATTSGEPSSVQLLTPDIAHIILYQISEFLNSDQEKDLIEASVEIAIKINPIVRGFHQTKALIELVIQLLPRPSRQVNGRLKGQLLELLEQLIPDHDWTNDDALYIRCLECLSKSLIYFNDHSNRTRAVETIGTLSIHREELKQSFVICTKLNSRSSTRLNEPDFEAREEGFRALSGKVWSQMSPVQCLPIVCNLLFFIKDEDELSTRAGATLGLKNFLKACKSTESSLHNEEIKFGSILEGTLIPAIQSGIKEKSELVRSEYVTVLAEIVRSDYDSVRDMQLLLGPDEESSFFNNILHIQPHRRIRALQRLSTDSVSLTTLNIGRFFIPLVESFSANKEGDAHNLVSAATATLEHLAQGLDWHRYRALLYRKMQEPGIFESKPQIRVIGALISALHNSSLQKRSHTEELFDLIPGHTSVQHKTSINLSRTLPEDVALHKSLSNSILSKLVEQIHYQDESSLDIRILAATFVVKLILVFPEDRIQESLPSVLIDVCNILKSKSQEARDSIRKTLAEIAAIIGSRYFGFLVKQLRTALKRGSQLHVLSYTIHSLLVSVSSTFEAGSIDYCLEDLVYVVTEDIFGAVSQDKEATGYVSSMKEVKKKSLGFDSMELLASLIALPRINALLSPISSQLERPRPKLEKIDELLRRIREGMRRNPKVDSRDALMLSFEILKENLSFKESAENMSVRAKKMASFTLQLMRRVLDKHEHLKTARNLAGFMPMFALAAAQPDEEVRMSLFRLLASIIKVPLPELDEYAGKFIQEARDTIEKAMSTNELLPQAALRLSSAILRERPEAVFSNANFETDIAFLLSKIKPDLQEPGRPGERDRQIVAFNFLKAVMGRGIVITEIYEVMDVVREVMLTAPEAPIPELSRGVYSRFILDYFPGQGKGLSKQLDFLTANLQYEHARGRLSVMEAMALILGKMGTEDVQPVLLSFFLPLVLVLVVDKDSQCQSVAGALLHKIFERADAERTNLFKAQMTKWMSPEGNMTWRQASLKIWQIYFTENTEVQKEANMVNRTVRNIIESTPEEKVTDEHQQLLAVALNMFQTLGTYFPGIALAKHTSETWTAIMSHVESENTQVRTAAAELIGNYFSDFARAASKVSTSQNLPLVGSHGLKLTAEELLTITMSSMTLLESTELHNEETIDKVIKNLAFVGRVCGLVENEAESEAAAILEKLVHEASRILRADIDISRAPAAKVACLKLLSTLYKVVPVPYFKSTLREVLIPLQHLSDRSIAAPKSPYPEFGRRYQEMVTLAEELQEQIKEKVGSELFLQEISAVQQIVRERRADRKAKRALEAVAEPEKVERDKKKKRAREKEKRHERNVAAAGKRRGW